MSEFIKQLKMILEDQRRDLVEIERSEKVLASHKICLTDEKREVKEAIAKSEQTLESLGEDKKER